MIFRQEGYSLIELVVAAGIAVAAVSAALSAVGPLQGVFATRLEEADVQQRLRVASDVLSRDLAMAGAGAYAGRLTGALNYYVAPILPYRFGTSDADQPDTFRPDTMTLLYVAPTPSQATITAQIDSNDFVLDADPGCPAALDACGLKPHDTVLVYDAAGHFDAFTVAGGAGNSLAVSHSGPAAASTIFGAGAKIAAAVERTYRLRADTATHTYQLVSSDAGSSADVPVVDHLVALRFEYYGDPQPPVLRSSTCGADQRSPCTTYGPQPPPLGVQTTAYPAGESCTFLLDPTGRVQLPRLETLAGDPDGRELVRLSASQLTDGPWCPDSLSANRFDADLLRIRKVTVTLRTEAASDSARGPIGALFVRAGTGRDVNRFVPDEEISFQVSPRNLNWNR